MTPVQQLRLSAWLRSFEADAAQLPAGRAATAPTLTAGSTVQALILGALPDGRTVIEVDGAPFQTRLPASVPVRVGQHLDLTVLREGQRPVFALSASAPSATPGTERVALSGLAQQLEAIAAAALRREAPAAGPAPPPVVADPEEAPAAWVTPLRSALETGGLFYESHQSRWLAGERPLESLAKEPQAAFTPRPGPQAQAHAPVAGEAVGGSQDTDPISSAARSSEPVAAAPSAAPPDETAAVPSMPPALAALVERQLQVLATQQAHWTGTVWPGQTLEWSVSEEGAGSAESEESPAWTSRLRLELPNLGVVEAVLALRGDQLRVGLNVAPGAAPRFKARVAELRAGLAGQGLEVTALAVSPHGSG